MAKISSRSKYMLIQRMSTSKPSLLVRDQCSCYGLPLHPCSGLSDTCMFYEGSYHSLNHVLL